MTILYFELKLFHDYPQSDANILEPGFITVFITGCSLPL